MWAAGSRSEVSRGAARAVIVINALWVLDSLILAAAWDGPSTIATVWIVLQAIVVAAFAALQTVGLRRLS